MADISHLTSSSLFSQVPKGNDATIEQFYDIENVKSASVQQLIDCTYLILKNGQLSVQETLKVWEIRLTLTLFNDQLPLAKREAVSLNNALYTLENPNAPPFTRMSSGNSVTDSNSRTLHQFSNVVYPLPKNNNGVIEYRLLLLILRLKSVPNLILVNELYKICYQMRLKGTSSEAIKLQAKLTNLSYEVIVVLVITRNYSTLLSFLISLRRDIGAKEDASEKGSYNERYNSNVCLIQVIVTLLMWTNSKREEDLADLPEDLVATFDLVDETSLVLLKHVLQSFGPVVGGPEPERIEISENLPLSKLAHLVWSKQLSARIICCTLATWELSNVFRTELIEENGKSQLVVEVAEEPQTKLDQVYGEIMKQWGYYFNKVYGME